MYVETRNLTKRYKSAGRNEKYFEAVSSVSLKIPEGKTIGLLGESGSGKSTLGQMIAGLTMATSGEVLCDGKKMKYPIKGEERKKIQILFQHPEISFNPAIPIISSMREPYRLCGKKAEEENILKDIEKFGLHKEHLYRLPKELSGGELQRAALARVLVLNPELIILDEPTSMLDVISQAQIIYYLKEYQRKHKTSFLFITHDRKLASMTCDKIYEMKKASLYYEKCKNHGNNP